MSASRENPNRFRLHCAFAFIAFRRNKSAQLISGFPLLDFNAKAQSPRGVVGATTGPP